MSRIARRPVALPKGVEVKIDGQHIEVKGQKGVISRELNSEVKAVLEHNVVKIEVKSKSKNAKAQSGTARALINNMVTGVSAGFQRKLTLVGVGYRAQLQGDAINLTLGFSHPISYKLPAGVKAVLPSQTEIILEGSDKQLVGQVAAEIRAFRPPEPYKGKGVRYSDEQISLKEAKKK